MKKIILLSSIVITSVFAINKASAQFSVSLNVGVPVAVAPEPVDPYYDYDDAGYYYYPDINCYYDIGASCYWYWYGNRWLYSRGIPACYRGYDFYRHRTMLSRRQFYSRGLPFAHGGYRGREYARNRGGYSYNREYAHNRGGYSYNRGYAYNRGNMNYQANHFQSRGASYNRPQFQQRGGGGFQNRGANAYRGGHGNIARSFNSGGGGQFGHHGR